MNEIDESAKILWDYCKLHKTLEHADSILVLGSYDPRVAEYGAQLFLVRRIHGRAEGKAYKYNGRRRATDKTLS